MPTTAFAHLALLLFLSTVTAQAPAPGPTVDCMTYLLNLSDCLSYVEVGSKLREPEKPCCGELAELVKDKPLCLCELLSNSTASIGFEINVARSVKLQTLCKVDGPSISLCSVVGYPVAGVPSHSPMPPVVGYPVAGVPSYSPMSPGMSPDDRVAPSLETKKGDNGANSGKFSHSSFFLVFLANTLFLS